MGEQKHLQMVQVTWPKWPQCPYMLKTFKKSSSLEPTYKGRWPWNLVCTIEYYLESVQMMLTMTCFMARSNLATYAFVWEKVKTMDFSETIVVYDIKVGRCSQLKWVHEALWVPKVKVIHWPWSRSLIFNIFKLLFLNNPVFNISSALRWAIQDKWSSFCLF